MPNLEFLDRTLDPSHGDCAAGTCQNFIDRIKSMEFQNVGKPIINLRTILGMV